MPVLPKIREVLLNSEKTEDVSVEIYLNLTKRIYKLYESDRDLMEQKINSVALNNETVPFLMDLAEKAIAAGDMKSHNVVLNLFTVFNKFSYMSAGLSQELLLRRVDHLVLKSLGDGEAVQVQGEDSKILMNEIISFINTLLSLNNYQNEFFQKLFGLAGIEILKHHNSEKKIKFIEDNSELVKQLLGKIVQECATIFEASDDFFFKYLFLTALRKIMIFLDPETLRSCIDQGLFANFISKTLDSQDLIVVALALFIVQSISSKIPEIKKSLARHGIIVFLKRLSACENLSTYSIPEISKKHPPAAAAGQNILFQGSNLQRNFSQQNKDKNDFMQQLLEWQKNPKLFLENLTKIQQGGGMEREIREGGNMDEEENREGEEEGEEETDLHDKNGSPKKMSEEMMEESDFKSELERDSVLGESQFDIDSLQNSRLLKQTLSTPGQLQDLFDFSAQSPQLQKLQSSMNEQAGADLREKRQAGLEQIQPHRLFDKPASSTPSKIAAAKEVKPAKPEYTLANAREDLSKLANETLSLVGDNVSDESQEFETLLKITKHLSEKKLDALSHLADFFNKNLRMTYYEFSQANFIRPLLSLLLADGNSTEDVARFMQAYYASFYRGSHPAVECLYSNLREFISRLPEISPLLSNDLLARSSFVQELKFLSTPLKIRVNFNQALAVGVIRDSFLGELGGEYPGLEAHIKEGLLSDAIQIHKMFKEVFLKQGNIWLQVERFASLKSVEMYLVDKFASKSLSMTNEEFAKKRSKESEDGTLRRTGGDADGETILTNSYLERRIDEQTSFGKDRDARKFFEVAPGDRRSSTSASPRSSWASTSS